MGVWILLRWYKCFKTDLLWWLYNLVNLLKIIELYIWSRWIICYVKYASIKLLKKKKRTRTSKSVESRIAGTRSTKFLKWVGGTSTSTYCFPDSCILLVGSATYNGLWFRVYTVSKGFSESSDGISKLMPQLCIQQAIAHSIRLLICHKSSGSHGYVHTAIPPLI